MDAVAASADVEQIDATNIKEKDLSGFEIKKKITTHKRELNTEKNVLAK